MQLVCVVFPCLIIICKEKALVFCFPEEIRSEEGFAFCDKDLTPSRMRTLGRRCSFRLSGLRCVQERSGYK